MFFDLLCFLSFKSTAKTNQLPKARQRHLSADSSYSTASSIGYESDDAPKKVKISSRQRPKTGDPRTRSIKEQRGTYRNIPIEQEHAGQKEDAADAISSSRNSLQPTKTAKHGNSSLLSPTASRVSKCIIKEQYNSK